MNKKLSKKLILFALVIISFLLTYRILPAAYEETSFTTMYIICFTYDMGHIGDITIEFNQDETLTVHLAYDMITGRYGGAGEGIWNAAGTFFTANFMIKITDEEQPITFSLYGVTILASITQLYELSGSFFSVLGACDIIDPNYTFSEKEKINCWFFGACSSEPIRRITLH